jgi:hypothetical protein
MLSEIVLKYNSRDSIRSVKLSDQAGYLKECPKLVFTKRFHDDNSTW